MIDFSGQQEFQNVIVGRINRVAALIEFSYLKKSTVWVFNCMGDISLYGCFAGTKRGEHKAEFLCTKV